MWFGIQSVKQLGQNDILLSLGSTKITSVKQAVKLTKNAGERLTLHLRRQYHRTTQASEPRFEDEASEKSEESLDSEYALADNKAWEEIESEMKSSDRISKKDSHGLPCPELTHRRLSKNSLDKVEIQIQPVDKNEPRRLEVRNFDTSRCESKSPMVSPKRQPQVKPSQLSTQMEPPIILRKSSKGEEDQFDVESLLEFEDEEDLSEVNRTRLVSASQNPCWNEMFEFEVEEEHRFLNICLWCREPDKIDKHDKVTKRKKNVRIGHVSFLLSEIALDCLTTVQGDTQKTKPLIPAEPKPGAIRTRCSMLASHPGFEPQLCHGDITVSFCFQPTEKFSEHYRKRLSKTTLQTTADEPVSKEIIERVECPKPNIPNAIRSPLKTIENHKFVVNCTPYQSASYCCVFCARKIWMGRGFKCNVCGMIVHKKCTDKCQEKTLCTREGPRNRAIPDEPWKPMTTQQSENQKNKVQDEKDIPSRTGGLLSKFRKDSAPTGKKNLGRNSRTSPPPEHKCLMAPNHSPKMRRKKSLPETQSSVDADPSKLHATAAGLPRTRSSTSLQVLLTQNASPTLQPHEVIVKHEEKSDNSDDSDCGGNLPNSKAKVMMNVSNFDEEIVTNAKEKGKELLSHLSLEERKEKLDTMVSIVQEQIDQATEYKGQLTKKEKSINDPAMKKVYQAEIRMIDEQNERLMMQLLHYCAGLQHCLDQQEEERQKVEQAQPTLPVSAGLQSNSSSPLPILSISVVPPDVTDGMMEANEGSINDGTNIDNGSDGDGNGNGNSVFDSSRPSMRATNAMRSNGAVTGGDTSEELEHNISKYPQMSVVISPPMLPPSPPSPTPLHHQEEEEEEEDEDEEEEEEQNEVPVQQQQSPSPPTATVTPYQDHLLPAATAVLQPVQQPLLLSSSSSSSTSPATAAWSSLSSSSSSSLPSSSSSSSSSTTATPAAATTATATTIAATAAATTTTSTTAAATTIIPTMSPESQPPTTPGVATTTTTTTTTAETTINQPQIADKQLNLLSKSVECSDS
ncbi:PDZ domain-containing protein 8 [Octopus bimaculoides]|nr:PDZ domain-containing protein 8 [Octopus bimaculoides]